MDLFRTQSAWDPLERINGQHSHRPQLTKFILPIFYRDFLKRKPIVTTTDSNSGLTLQLCRTIQDIGSPDSQTSPESTAEILPRHLADFQDSTNPNPSRKTSLDLRFGIPSLGAINQPIESLRTLTRTTFTGIS